MSIFSILLITSLHILIPSLSFAWFQLVIELLPQALQTQYLKLTLNPSKAWVIAVLNLASLPRSFQLFTTQITIRQVINLIRLNWFNQRLGFLFPIQLTTPNIPANLITQLPTHQILGFMKPTIKLSKRLPPQIEDIELLAEIANLKV
jgi:hypothetical protein